MDLCRCMDSEEDEDICHNLGQKEDESGEEDEEEDNVDDDVDNDD